MGNAVTKRDRQQLVRSLVKVKKTQKKLVNTSAELSNCLKRMPVSLRQWLGFLAIDTGRTPDEVIDPLIECADMFSEGMVECKRKIKFFRKRVKNKDYKGE